MGRDEMNLAEFPLATLADRAPRGCKTLVFEDCISDRSQNEHRVRRLTISASDKHGLPTAADDEVILGLVQVSQAAGFACRRVRFSRYQLIRLLGWRDEGRSYRRLEQSLKRWLGVTLYYENAWRDNTAKRWVDAHFHVLDDLVLYRRPKQQVKTGVENGDFAQSSFAWNEIVFRSFQAGFVKKLDLDFYRGLKRAAAKRMYRFLDKKFHFRSTLEFDLRAFACERVGLSRRYDVAQLKRRLNPAIAELEQAGFLAPLPANERFHRLRRGHWEIVLVRARNERHERRPARRLTELELQLVDRGVTPSTAAQLVGQYDAERIQGKVVVFDALRQRRDRLISRNPAGFLVQSIRDDYQPPASFVREATGRSVCQVPGPNGRFGSVLSSRPCPRRRARQAEKSPVTEHLSRLSESEREDLEAKALSQARGVAAEGYRRATVAGNAGLIQHYRQIIVEQYLRKTQCASAT